MQETCQNIYKNARKTAGLTQERWAEQLGISVESIGLYESGRGLPSDDVVTRMAEVAVMPVLGYWHLKAKSGLANDILPEVQRLQLPLAVVQLLSRIQAFASKHRTDELLHIAEDGRIDDTERELFTQIVAELDSVVQAAMALKFAEGAEQP